MSDRSLIEKYNVAAPRYTSYPTVPYWDEDAPDILHWKECVRQALLSNPEQGLSIYIHLPFCESLCTYCGCNTRITVNHAVEEPYIDAVLKEWKMYAELFPFRPKITELHLGGGTPTFFKASNLKKLIEGLMQYADISSAQDFGFEGHPANTTFCHLETLYNLGFRRVSFGIQDFDLEVQDVINRYQTFEQVKKVTDEARAIGYTSVNYDLVYGLPMQTLNGMTDTIEKVLLLKPDRIAFYSYAHVPWLKPGQREFTEMDLPTGEAKRQLYETGMYMLEANGYIKIGVDHFALRYDSLHSSVQSKTLHRNFMGYTTTSTRLLIGLGVSGISDSWNAYSQNVKVVEEYEQLIVQNQLPVFKGHFLNEEDLILRKHILNLMCRMKTAWHYSKQQCEALYEGLKRMEGLEKDGLVHIDPFQLTITERGRPFVRNICMTLDVRLWRRRSAEGTAYRGSLAV